MRATLASRLGSARRRAAALVLATATVVSVGAGLATPASAAGDVAKPDIYGCFAWGGTVYSGQPVYLQYWNPTTAKWVSTRNANTNSAGCIRFNDITPGHFYHLEAYKFFTMPMGYSSYYYLGDTGYVQTAKNDVLFKVSTPTAPTYVYGPYYV
jgi:hypothetical protein